MLDGNSTKYSTLLQSLIHNSASKLAISIISNKKQSCHRETARRGEKHVQPNSQGKT